MREDMEDKFIVSEADAEIIATLFRQGVSDYPAIIKAVKWDKAKQKQFYDFMTLMGYYDFGNSLLNEDVAPSLSNIRVPEDKYVEFFQNLPIEFSEDFWDEEWYRAAYDELRQFLIRLDKQNPSFKKKKGYSLDDMEQIIGMAFCPLTQKPEKLCVEIISLMRVRLRRTGKDIFSFDEILLAFDKAFANYFDQIPMWRRLKEMIHKMNLAPAPFKSICEGKKTIEMRLYDEKRARIKIDDEIEFENVDSHQKIKCCVINLTRYKDFFELYSNCEKAAIGYSINETANAEDMYTYYSPEQINKNGVLAIEIKLI